MRLWKNKGLNTPNWLRKTVERKGLKQNFFETIVEGKFTPEHIETIITAPGATLKRSEQSEAFIEAEWQKRLEAGLREFPDKDRKASRYRFVSAEKVGDKVRITLDPCISYHDAIGSRPREFERKFGQEYMPNPAGVTAVVRAKNRAGKEHVLLTLRSPEHDFKGGGYHASTTGAMDIGKDKTPADTAVRETVEEVGLTVAEIRDVVCRGVVTQTLVFGTEIIFEASTDVPVEEILERKTDEENELLFIPATAKKLREWIVVPTNANIATTNAAVLMVGRDIVEKEEGPKAAQKWYDDMMKFLAVRSEQVRKRGSDTLENRDVTRVRVKVRHTRSERE